METINYQWITNSKGTIGIVLAENEFNQQAYMSLVQGFNEEADIEDVKSWGAKLTMEQAKGFFPSQVNEETYKR